MRTLAWIGAACLLLGGAAPLRANDVVFPGASWEIKDPGQLGLDKKKLDEFAAAIGGSGVVIKDGYLVKSWGNQTFKKDWGSAAKPVYTTMLFFAIKEERIVWVDQLVSDFGWKMIPKDEPMNFKHLANMLSGYARDEPPGQAWAYNDYAISLYAKTIFDKAFNEGSPNNAVMKPGRLGALTFQDGAILDGLRIKTTPRDFARIGWFWLNEGNWAGKQMLPKWWFPWFFKPGVGKNTPRTQKGGTDYLEVGTVGGGSNQTALGPGIYGFTLWHNATGTPTGARTWPALPGDAYAAMGHWDKEIVLVIPSLNIVVAAWGTWGEFRPGYGRAGMNQTMKLLAQAAGFKRPPADFNGDDHIDLSDYTDFLTAFYGGRAVADIDGDRRIRVEDLLEFRARWVADVQEQQP